jgi:YfiH family protein
VVLTIFSADCIPVLLYDPVRRVVAAVHAGWVGTARGIASRAAEKMTAVFGSRPDDILAAIGPGISKCCFETHEDVPNAMTEAMGAPALTCIHALENGKYKVDLKGLNAQWLLKAGLRRRISPWTATVPCVIRKSIGATGRTGNAAAARRL